MNSLLQKKNWPFIALFIATVVMIVLALIANGTADDGDSVYHYLFARYAFAHPANFLNHWAKPLFVMVAAPFAQFGMTGIKMLNVAFWSIQIYCSIRIAEHLEIRNAWLLPVFAVLAPMNVTHTLSGLTEPMFACWFALSVLLLLRKQYAIAYILFSFLPFVRSEGLIILCPLLLYALWRRQYIYLPLFLLGHVVLGFAGKPLYGDFWWIFNKMSYRGLVSAYGSGPWDHFINMTPAIIGIALSLMLVAGLIFGLFRLILNGAWRRDDYARNEAWLIYGMFLAYFFAHTIFWWKGMFNSFGMLRVMLGIMPAMLLICLRGWNMLSAGFSKIHPLAVRIGWALFLVGLLWSFFGRMRWNDHFNLKPSQLAMQQAVKAVKEKFPDDDKYVYYTGSFSPALFLGLDVFDGYYCRQPWRLYSGEPVPEQSFIFYDEWYFGHDGQVPLEQLQKDERFTLFGIFGGDKGSGAGSKIHVFYVKPSSTTPKWNYFKQWTEVSENPKVIEVAGKPALKLNSQQPYSPVFTAGLQSFPRNAKIAISFDAYSEKGGADMPGVIVFDTKTEMQKPEWRATSLKTDTVPAGVWHSYRFIERLPVSLSPDDKFGTCIWNDVAEPLYINNFKIELVSN